MSGTLVLDSEGLSKTVLRERAMMARLAQAHLDGLRVVTSAATLVEARNPQMDQARFDWAVSRLIIEPVTEPIARAASKLLVTNGLHGHEHAIDAMVAATALAAAAPRIVLTSGPGDLTRLCGKSVHVVRI
ncbi:MAG TPA: DNA-binding protein [Streptosporangiaceae bacterium]|nr:DNA-binding protein [Streptosporangiaceae bacterium]